MNLRISSADSEQRAYRSSENVAKSLAFLRAYQLEAHQIDGHDHFCYVGAVIQDHAKSLSSLLRGNPP